MEILSTWKWERAESFLKEQASPLSSSRPYVGVYCVLPICKDFHQLNNMPPPAILLLNFPLSVKFDSLSTKVWVSARKKRAVWVKSFVVEGKADEICGGASREMNINCQQIIASQVKNQPKTAAATMWSLSKHTAFSGFQSSSSRLSQLSFYVSAAFSDVELNKREKHGILSLRPCLGFAAAAVEVSILWTRFSLDGEGEWEKL